MSSYSLHNDQQLAALLKAGDHVAFTEVYVDVSEICYTLFRGKLTTCFAGKKMQLML